MHFGVPGNDRAIGKYRFALEFPSPVSRNAFDRLCSAVQGPDPYFNKLIRILATRCMTQVTMSAALTAASFALSQNFFHMRAA
jgi:hypothetical protein